MVDVFISYSRTDLAKVTQLAQAVEAEGYQVWWDADLPPHLSYGDVITAKIGMCKAAIVVWSEAAAASEWVRAEADMARNQKKLVQTALDNIMPPLPFNQIQYAEIGDWHGEADHPGWRKVKVSLAELCGREAGAEPRTEPTVPVRPAPVAPPASVAPASRWPLFVGIAVGAIALLVAGWAIMREQYLEGELAAEERLVQSLAEGRSAPPEQAASAEEAGDSATSASAQDVSVPDEPPIASTEGMVIPDSGQRLLTAAEIANFGPATLAIARNEIYARKGRRFGRAGLRDHFSQFTWYRPTANEVSLNAIERQNVALLRAAEARYGQ